MKVKQLIDKLQSFDLDLEVTIMAEGYRDDIYDVEYDEDTRGVLIY